MPWGVELGLALVWQVCVLLLAVSYLRVVFSDPGFVSEELSSELLSAAESPSVQAGFPGLWRTRVTTRGRPTRGQIGRGPRGARAEASSTSSRAEDAGGFDSDEELQVAPHAPLLCSDGDAYQRIGRGSLGAGSDQGAAVAVQQVVVPHTLRLTWCNKCEALRPPRAHHCILCNRCVLKMDHHCPWVSNCVGLKNYKYFVLFIVYSFLACAVEAAVLGPRVWGPAIRCEAGREDAQKAGRLEAGRVAEGCRRVGGAQESLALSLSFAVALALTVFLGMHSALLLFGSSTLEFHVFGFKSPYSLGFARNLESVFGPGSLLEKVLPITGWATAAASPAEHAYDLGTHVPLVASVRAIEHLAPPPSSSSSSSSASGSPPVGWLARLIRPEWARNAGLFLRRQLQYRPPAMISLPAGPGEANPPPAALVAYWLSTGDQRDPSRQAGGEDEGGFSGNPIEITESREAFLRGADLATVVV